MCFLPQCARFREWKGRVSYNKTDRGRRGEMTSWARGRAVSPRVPVKGAVGLWWASVGKCMCGNLEGWGCPLWAGRYTSSSSWPHFPQQSWSRLSFLSGKTLPTERPPATTGKLRTAKYSLLLQNLEFTCRPLDHGTQGLRHQKERWSRSLWG